jgi:hypothetical protein
LLLFLPVSFEKKKSNKIPAVLDAKKGVNFCRVVIGLLLQGGSPDVRRAFEYASLHANSFREGIQH